MFGLLGCSAIELVFDLGFGASGAVNAYLSQEADFIFLKNGEIKTRKAMEPQCLCVQSKIKQTAKQPLEEAWTLQGTPRPREGVPPGRGASSFPPTCHLPLPVQRVTRTQWGLLPDSWLQEPSTHVKQTRQEGMADVSHVSAETTRTGV